MVLQCISLGLEKFPNTLSDDKAIRKHVKCASRVLGLYTIRRDYLFHVGCSEVYKGVVKGGEWKLEVRVESELWDRYDPHSDGQKEHIHTVTLQPVKKK